MTAPVVRSDAYNDRAAWMAIQTAKAVFNFGVIDAQLVEPKDWLLRVQLLKAVTKASKHLALHLSAVVPSMGDEELDRLSILGKPRMS